jgi:hypothetical protein
MTLMNQAWEDAIAFIKRESALLVPLALATLLVGDVVGALARPASPSAQSSLLANFAVLAAAIWSIVGQLSITALVLKPGSSVGEAIASGMRRLGKVLLVALLLGVALALAMLPVVVALVSYGFNPAVPDSVRNVPTWAAVYTGVLAVVTLWFAARLMLINPLLVDRNPGALEAIKTGFGLTRGIVAQIIIVLTIYLVVLVIMLNAVRFVAGSLFALLAGAVGSPFLGSVLTALASGIVASALSLLAAVFIAMLYRRVSSRV